MGEVNIQDLKRFKQIVTTLSSHGFGAILDKRRVSALSHTHIPETRLRLALESLGGAFVKLGQMLALRPDLIPASYCEELSKLQDNTPQVTYAQIEKQLKKTYARPLSSMFSHINQKALASGSVAQVHVVTLTNKSKGVLKIKKEGVEKIFKEDIHLLKYFAHKLKKHVKIIDTEEIIKEFEDYTQRELDFSYEAKYLKEFHKLSLGVKTPQLFDALCKDDVLVMSQLEGTSLRKKLRGNFPNRKLLAKNLAHSIMKQVFVHGLFHADPHPGNILVNKKELGLVDFGIVGEVNTKTKIKLTIILYSLIHKDVQTLTKYLLKLNITDEPINKEQFSADLKATLSPYYNKKLGDVKLSILFTQALEVAKKYNIKIPREYVLLGKTVVTTESVCELIYPSFNFIEVAKPFLKEHLPKIFSSKYMIQETKAHALDYAEMFQSLPENVKELIEIKKKEEHTMEVAMLNMEKHLHRMEGEFVLGIIALFLFVLSVITMNFGIPTTIGTSTISIFFMMMGLFALAATIAGILKQRN